MSATMAEKILASNAGLNSVQPGQVVTVDVGLAVVDEVQVRIFEHIFSQIAQEVWDKDKAVVLVDHYLPPSNQEQAEAVKLAREFGQQHKLRNLVLTEGIKHQALRTLKLVVPGSVLVATDSHTNTLGALGCFATALGPSDVAVVFREGRTWLKVPATIRIELTGNLAAGVSVRDVAQYLIWKHGSRFGRDKAIEFAGSAIRDLSLDARMTLTNLTTEMGARAGMVVPDDRLTHYAEQLGRPYRVFASDPDAHYDTVLSLDIGTVPPLVALPHHPTNVVPIYEAPPTTIHQAFVGTCTNGRLEDLQVVARVLKGRKVHPGVRLLVIPASRYDYLAALKAGLLETMYEAGAIIEDANCGPCAGLHQGTLASNEVMVASSPRNFRGRAGDNTAQIFLASPATVAASAIAGRLADPRPFLGG